MANIEQQQGMGQKMSITGAYICLDELSIHVRQLSLQNVDETWVS